MKNVFWIFIISFVFNFGLVKAETIPSMEDMANASRPAIVRVVSSVNGYIDVPNFTFDFHNFEIIDPPEGSAPVNFPFDSLYSSVDGTGFIVSEDGIIVTNSHIVNGVVDDQYRYIADLYINSATDEEIDQAISRYGDINKAYDAVYEKIYKYVKEKSQKNFTNEIRVLKPDDKSKEFWTLFDNGYEAKVLYFNDNFADDNKDIAILKIEENKLPTVLMNEDSGNILVGQKIFTFGFPSSAFFAEGDYLEPTFSQGNLNAIKNDEGVDIYQTDAGVSEGSSGSPLFNEEGKVIGIVTYLSGDSSSGTKFGFAIPIKLVQEILSSQNITLNQNTYFESYTNGILLMQDKHCKKAIESFKKASDVNKAFGTDRYLDPKIDSCQKMIESGQSIDSIWGQSLIWIKNNMIQAISLGSAILLMILLIILATVRIKKDEEKIEEIEEQVEKMEEHEKVCDSGHQHVEDKQPVIAESVTIKPPVIKPLTTPQSTENQSPMTGKTPSSSSDAIPLQSNNNM